MVRAGIVLFALGLVLGVAQGGVAQDFPYSVPQAPEFEYRGNSTGDPSGTSADRPSTKRSPHSRPQMEDEPVDYRSVRPYAPQDGQPPQRVRRSRPDSASPSPRYATPAPEGYGPPQDTRSAPLTPEGYGPAPIRTPAAAMPTPAQRPPTAAMPAPTQPEERPDCSMYPMVIARSRSDPEMQMAARQYLSCLLKNGWNMDQARMQVISTIESTYRLSQ
jgi:hypothetical protein